MSKGNPRQALSLKLTLSAHSSFAEGTVFHVAEAAAPADLEISLLALELCP